MKTTLRSFGWNKWDKILLGAALITAILRIILPAANIESWYSRLLFPVIRKSLDFLHNVLPIHWLWIAIFGLLIYILLSIIRSLKTEISFWNRLGRVLLKSLSLFALIFTLFMWLWGFNYGRVDLYDQLSIEGKPLSLIQLKKMAQIEQDKIIDLRSRISWPEKLSANWRYQLPDNSEELILNATFELFEELDLGLPGKPSPKYLRPKGTLLRLNTAGFYSPWTGEPNVDSGLHPLQIPFVLAHELSHSLAITNEGACNFLAVLVGRKIDDPKIRYGFELSYWKYVMGSLRRMNNYEYKYLREKLPESIKNDLNSIRENGDQYPEFFPRIRNWLYDSYLKSQGVKEGLASYSQVVNMVADWDARSK